MFKLLFRSNHSFSLHFTHLLKQPTDWFIYLISYQPFIDNQYNSLLIKRQSVLSKCKFQKPDCVIFLFHKKIHKKFNDTWLLGFHSTAYVFSCWKVKENKKTNKKKNRNNNKNDSIIRKLSVVMSTWCTNSEHELFQIVKAKVPIFEVRFSQTSFNL